MKLNELTPDQQALLQIVRDEWLKIGLCTEPLNFEAAKLAVKSVYETANLPAPKLILRAGDPIECALTAVIFNYSNIDQVWAQVRAQVWDQVLDQVGDQVRAQVLDQVLDQVGDQVRAQVWDQVGAQVGDKVRGQVWAQVRAQVRDQVRDQVWDQVRAQVRAQVRDQVRDQVWDQVRDQVWDQVRDQVWDQVRAQVYGAHDAGWLAFYAFLDCIGINHIEPLRPLMELSRHCGWWAPYTNVAILQDRPSVLNFDDMCRAHCENGPAIAYRTGFSVYCIHGVRVPEYVVMRPDEITAQKCLDENNLEIRRVMIERFGVDRFVLEIGGETVDMDFVPVSQNSEALMPRALIRLPDGQQFMHGTDGSTERCYFMAVDPTTKTCREAHQSICGLDERLCVAQS